MLEDSKRCKIQLVNEDTTLFAQSVLTDENWETFVQRCYDSSRFFALLLVSDNG